MHPSVWIHFIITMLSGRTQTKNRSISCMISIYLYFLSMQAHLWWQKADHWLSGRAGQWVSEPSLRLDNAEWILREIVTLCSSIPKILPAKGLIRGKRVFMQPCVILPDSGFRNTVLGFPKENTLVGNGGMDRKSYKPQRALLSGIHCQSRWLVLIYCSGWAGARGGSLPTERWTLILPLCCHWFSFGEWKIEAFVLSLADKPHSRILQAYCEQEERVSGWGLPYLSIPLEAFWEQWELICF